ncbi:MAG: response regulator transcription factor [Porphyromonas sp.]|nr:response regulator transcription factor [Porphyromonas sp.]
MMKKTKKILVVDDEIDITDILQFNLEYEGFDVTVAGSAEEALELLDDTYCLLVLDVMMGGMTGFKMADKLRKEGNNIPIIFLTAKDTENDMLTGFSIGGDDYIKKPFSIKELIARVHSVLNRTYGSDGSPTVDPTTPVLHIGPLTIDLEAMKISTEEGEVDVTKTEYDILKLLATNQGRIFSRSEILDAVWPDNSVVLERTVDVHIARLRKKLGEYGQCIVNRVGFGYTFKDN